MKKYLVYILKDPISNEIKYVGKSSSGLERPKQHFTNYELSRFPNTYKSRWICKLKRFGILPIIEIIQEFSTNEDCLKAEVYWIKYFTSIGCKLTNSTEGGDGLTHKHFDSTIKVLQEKCSKMWEDEEFRQRNIEAQKLANKKEEVFRKRSEASKKKWQDPVWRANKLAKLKARMANPEKKKETYDKFILSRKGKPLSEEHKQKIADARRGKKYRIYEENN